MDTIKCACCVVAVYEQRAPSKQDTFPTIDWQQRRQRDADKIEKKRRWTRDERWESERERERRLRDREAIISTFTRGYFLLRIIKGQWNKDSLFVSFISLAWLRLARVRVCLCIWLELVRQLRLVASRKQWQLAITPWAIEYRSTCNQDALVAGEPPRTLPLRWRPAPSTSKHQSTLQLYHLFNRNEHVCCTINLTRWNLNGKTIKVMLSCAGQHRNSSLLSAL